MSTYAAPPQVWVSLHIITSATINTIVTTTLLAAPGAGIAYVIRYVWAMANRGNAAGSLIEAHFNAGGGGADIWGTTLNVAASTGSDSHDWPAPGVLLAANTALGIIQSCPVASQGFDVGVGYDVYSF